MGRSYIVPMIALHQEYQPYVLSPPDFRRTLYFRPSRPSPQKKLHLGQ
jgi:hypothetical protein